MKHVLYFSYGQRVYEWELGLHSQRIEQYTPYDITSVCPGHTVSTSLHTTALLLPATVPNLQMFVDQCHKQESKSPWMNPHTYTPTLAQL
jgi:hypothetical protein